MVERCQTHVCLPHPCRAAPGVPGGTHTPVSMPKNAVQEGSRTPSLPGCGLPIPALAPRSPLMLKTDAQTPQKQECW